MRATENERRDWAVIAFILLFGLFWILVAGGWALRFAPSWELNTNVESKLDPNSDYLTNRPSGFIEPVDPAILTNSEWVNAALTPGASFSPSQQLPEATSVSSTPLTPGTMVTTQTAYVTSTVLTTSTATVWTSATNTLIYFPPPATSTSKSKPVSTSTPTPTSVSTQSPTSTGNTTSTPTPTTTSSGTATSAPTSPSTGTATATTFPAGTMTPSQTPTSTGTVTSTFTVTATATATNTPDLSEPDFGGPDGNTILLGNGTWVEFNLSGFLLDGNSAWDLIYYEKEETSAAGKIHLGAVLIEVYDQTTGAWYAIYNWGDGIADLNTSYNNGNAEPDGFPVNKSLLYGTSPLNTGIAIDLDAPAIGQGGNVGDSITKIRITSLSSNDCEIDSLQMMR